MDGSNGAEGDGPPLDPSTRPPLRDNSRARARARATTRESARSLTRRERRALELREVVVHVRDGEDVGVHVDDALVPRESVIVTRAEKTSRPRGGTRFPTKCNRQRDILPRAETSRESLVLRERPEPNLTPSCRARRKHALHVSHACKSQHERTVVICIHTSRSADMALRPAHARTRTHTHTHTARSKRSTRAEHCAVPC